MRNTGCNLSERMMFGNGSIRDLIETTPHVQQLSLLGTTMGSPRDFAALLRVLDGAPWRPVVDTVFPLAEAAAAHERMDAGAHFGKLVLSVAP